MRKKKLLLAIIAVSILIFILEWETTFSRATNGPFKVVVSCDGPIEPGLRQDILVYPLEPGNFSPWEKAKLVARLEVRDPHGSFSPISTAELLSNQKFPLRFTFAIPESISASKVFFNLYTNNFSHDRLFSREMQVRKDIGIAVFPPGKQVFCGDWLNLKILALNRRTGAGVYKTPIRVKMVTPFDMVTVNRIINSEIDGTCVFTTFINSNSPQGLYKFEVSYGNQVINLALPFLSSQRRIAGISKSVATTGIPLINNTLPTEPDKKLFHISFPEKKKLISELRPGNNQFSFSFDCSNSSFRSIEVWQNGAVLNQSILPIESGRSSYPIPRTTHLNSPVKVKLWMIKNGNFESEEQVLKFAENNSSTVTAFLLSLHKIIEAVSEDFSNNFYYSPTPLYSNINTPEQTLPNFESTILIEPLTEELQQLQSNFSTNDSMRFLEISTNREYFGSRFILVDSEIDLSRYNFDQLKIHLNPNTFFRRFISALYQPVSGIGTILAEAETRIMRFNFLNLPEQSSELEKLEGLLIPISEFMQFSEAHKEELEHLRARANKVLSNMSALIHLPEKLQKKYAELGKQSLNIGPASPIIESVLSEDILHNALKKGGKVSLETTSSKFPVSLSSNVVDFKNRSFTGSKRLLEKLTNLRTTPVLIELIYSSSGKLK